MTSAPDALLDPGRAGERGLDFARPAPADGYAWWYLDALSPDGRFGLTLIAFVGSVFSPYYAAARARGAADPNAHCCLNVCLYLPGARRWTMTERGPGHVSRTADRFVIGPSALDWDGRRLRIRFDEETALRRRPVRGEVIAAPARLLDRSFPLDPAGRHVWRPISTDVAVEARLDAPSLSWSGRGYLDFNAGEAPLERDFRAWSWSRSACDASGVAHVDYDTTLADGSRASLALDIGPQGVTTRPAAPTLSLRPTLCGLARRAHGDRGRVVSAFEDTPFYARSSLRLQETGVSRVAMHETLSLARFASPAMQWALPYRIKRQD